MRLRRIVAVFGVSGVGKSTLIQNFIAEHKEWLHLQAGSLIKEALRSVDRDQLRLVGNDELMVNQRLMIGEFWKAVDAEPNQNIIFDGHSVIDTGGGLVKIPEDIIEALNPTALIFVESQPANIKARREADTSRKRPLLSSEAINTQQSSAYEQVLHYANMLNIPIHKVKADDVDVDSFKKAILR